MPRGESSIIVRTAGRAEFPTGAMLLAACLGFPEREAIPGWQMLTASRHGGLALAALHGDALVGWSFAFPARQGNETYLFSCGLAVRRDYRSRGIGRRLKEAQRVEAGKRGYRRIVWTAEPLSSAALHLYLTGLGARLTGYSSGLYDGVRQGSDLPQDDVDIEWNLDEPTATAARRAPGGPRLTRTESITGAERRLLEVTDGIGSDFAVIELPWDIRGLVERHPDEALRWRMGVRSALRRLIAVGYQGIGVHVERSEHRSFLCLSRVS